MYFNDTIFFLLYARLSHMIKKYLPPHIRWVYGLSEWVFAHGTTKKTQPLQLHYKNVCCCFSFIKKHTVFSCFFSYIYFIIPSILSSILIWQWSNIILCILNRKKNKKEKMTIKKNSPRKTKKFEKIKIGQE